MEYALDRTRTFAEASADGIMIHSRKKDSVEIVWTCDKFRAEDTLMYHRAKEVDDRLMSVKDIITLIDEL